MSDAKKCKATTNAGAACVMPAQDGDGRCIAHINRDNAKDRARNVPPTGACGYARPGLGQEKACRNPSPDGGRCSLHTDAAIMEREKRIDDAVDAELISLRTRQDRAATHKGEHAAKCREAERRRAEEMLREADVLQRATTLFAEFMRIHADLLTAAGRHHNSGEIEAAIAATALATEIRVARNQAQRYVDGKRKPHNGTYNPSDY